LSVLREAHGLVHGDRGDTYGPPWEDYGRTADLFNTITGRDLTTVEAVLFMVCVKLSRLGHGHQIGLPADRLRDSIVDAAGYLECLHETLIQPQEVTDERSV
jgi:hypothetical protein